MNITISTQVLAWFIAVLVLLAIGVFLIIVLVKLIGLINKVNKLIEENKENVRTTMKNVAEITAHTNTISLSLKDVTAEVAGGVDEFTSSIKSSRSFTDSAGIASNIILSIIKFFKKK
jgi:uncharacterized protein YoxC